MKFLSRWFNNSDHYNPLKLKYAKYYIGAMAIINILIYLSNYVEIGAFWAVSNQLPANKIEQINYDDIEYSYVPIKSNLILVRLMFARFEGGDFYSNSFLTAIGLLICILFLVKFINVSLNEEGIFSKKAISKFNMVGVICLIFFFIETIEMKFAEKYFQNEYPNQNLQIWKGQYSSIFWLLFGCSIFFTSNLFAHAGKLKTETDLTI